MSASIELPHRTWAPGSVLRGRVCLLPLPGDEGRTVELSVLWETEGKGSTDVGVVLHRVLSGGDAVSGRAEHDFEVRLPMLPLTYHGQVLKILWRVRVRRLARLGSDDVIDHDFEVAWLSDPA